MTSGPYAAGPGTRWLSESWARGRPAIGTCAVTTTATATVTRNSSSYSTAYDGPFPRPVYEDRRNTTHATHVRFGPLACPRACGLAWIILSPTCWTQYASGSQGPFGEIPNNRMPIFWAAGRKSGWLAHFNTNLEVFNVIVEVCNGFAGAALRPRAAGADGVNFYNYGLIPAARLDWAGAASASITGRAHA